MSKELIVKSNNLIGAMYNMTLQEQKLVLKLISTIGKEDNTFQKVTLSVKDLAIELGLSTDGYYNVMRGVTKSLIGRTINVKEATNYLQFSWIISAEYIGNKGIVVLELNPRLKPYLLQLTDNFTQYRISNVLSLNSMYSIRLYELLKQYEKLKDRTISIVELRSLLGIEVSKYKLYANFKMKVLETACKEINEKTDICIEIKEQKEARKVTSIKFCIKKNEAHKISEVSPNTTTDLKATVKEPITEIKEYDSIIETLYKKIKVSERVITLKDYLKTTLETKSYETVESNIAYSNTNARSNYIAFLKRAIEEDYAVDTRLKVKSFKPTIVPTTSEVEVVEGGLSELQLLELIKQIPVEEYDKLKSEYDRNKFIPKSIVSLERYIVANRLS